MRVFTFNCCALPLVSGDIAARLDRTGKAVSLLNPDIALFQEVFTPRHLGMLARRLKAWPHVFSAARRWRGFGGGLAVFSKHPLEEPRFHLFRAQGPVIRYSGVNRISRKGFITAWIRGPRGMDFRLVDTHPVADFLAWREGPLGPKAFGVKSRMERVWKRMAIARGDPYPEVQRRQLGELKEYLLDLGKDEPVVLGGDLNVPARSDVFKAFLRETRMRDCMARVARPSVRSEKFYRVPVFDAPHRRIDFLLLRGGTRGRFRTLRARYVLTQRTKIPGKGQMRLSDHLGVAADLRWKAANS